MKFAAIAGVGLLILVGCSQDMTGSTKMNTGERLAPSSSGKCTQMVGTQQYKVACPP